MDIIERIDYDGKNRWPLKSYSLHRIDSIAFFENRIYLSKRSTNRREMWHFNRRDPRQNKMIMVNEKQPLEIRIFHRQHQPDAVNPCRSASASAANADRPEKLCDHLCVPAYDEKHAAFAKCVCKTGYNRNPLTQRCQFGNHSTFLLYARRRPSVIHGVSLTNTAEEVMVPIADLGRPIHMDFDAKRERIYFIHKARYNALLYTN